MKNMNGKQVKRDRRMAKTDKERGIGRERERERERGGGVDLMGLCCLTHCFLLSLELKLIVGGNLQLDLTKQTKS
jgi:hypothetical protein